MTNNKDLNYIAECAESVGIHVDEHTAISIPFIADVMRKMREQEPCEDCISRAEAINAISHAELSFQVESDLNFENYKREVQEIADGILKGQVKAISDLPSIQPKTDVLDKIMKEIKEIYADIDDVCIKNGLNLARRIINKYKAESEDKE